MEKFIAGRLYNNDDGVRGGTRPAIIIATVGMALGLLVMIVTISVTRGFRHQVRDKVYGIAQHIQVTNYNSGMGSEELPITCTEQVLRRFLESSNVRHVQRYVEKPGILRTDSAFQGFILKGVGPEYDFSFLSDYLVEGAMPDWTDSLSSNALLLSKSLADKMCYSIGDAVDVYFVQERVRMRRLTLVGLYRTGFSAFDDMYGIAGIGILQRLQGWSGDKTTGLEIAVTDVDSLYEGYLQVRSILSDISEDTGEQYLVQTTEQLNSGLFAWLDILNVNLWVILILMLGIAGFTMISGLLIIIFERVRTIGILKAMGASDSTVRKIFLHLSARIITKGMVIGNVAGIALCLLQMKFSFVPLDPANYYLNNVPVELNLWWILLLNVAMFILSMLMLVGPSAVISRISPSRSMRFE
ncbi:MAG: ABC transporter permease [Bacteroidaceae bacterium]|nr:ABC transporter permease [Bacteroidaceae bacterium]